MSTGFILNFGSGLLGLGKWLCQTLGLRDGKAEKKEMGQKTG